MTNKAFPMTDRVAQGYDPDMTLTDIAQILSAMTETYPTSKCQQLARELAVELGEAYLDKVCQQLMAAPFWNKRNCGS
jgi:hypothetical protein